MQFILTGFTQDMGFRVFAFEGIKTDRTRTKYTVRADLGLVRKYSIRVQELPLLCRALLEKFGEDEEKRGIIFGEDDMRHHADECALARAAAPKKSPRRTPGKLGAAWRSPQTSRGAGFENSSTKNPT